MVVRGLGKIGGRVVLNRMMHKSGAVNKFVKVITNGEVTKPKLADKVASNVMNIVKEHSGLVVGNDMLGKRTAEIVTQSVSTLFQNTKAQASEGIAPLVELLAASKGQTEYVQRLAGSLVQHFAADQLQDHVLERILSALGQQPGGEEVLKLTLNNALRFPGGKVISAATMDILKDAILHRDEYKETTWLHRTAAWEIRKALTPEGKKLPPAPENVEALHTAVNMGMSAWSFVTNMLDTVQQKRGISPMEQDASAAFTDAWSMDFSVTANMSAKSFASQVVKAHTLGMQKYLDDNIEKLPDGVRTKFVQQRDAINSFLQKTPEATIRVAQNWSGGLDFMTSNSSILCPPSGKFIEIMSESLKYKPEETEVFNGYTVAKDFPDNIASGVNITVRNPDPHEAVSKPLDRARQAFMMRQNVVKNSVQDSTALEKNVEVTVVPDAIHQAVNKLASAVKNDVALGNADPEKNLVADVFPEFITQGIEQLKKIAKEAILSLGQENTQRLASKAVSQTIDMVANAKNTVFGEPAKTEQPPGRVSKKSLQTIKQLSQMVNNNPSQLTELTGYMGRDLQYVVGFAVLDQFTHCKDDIYATVPTASTASITMKLDQPEIHYTVSKDNNNINLETTVIFPILMYGDSPERLEKTTGKSYVASTSNIQFRQGEIVDKTVTDIDIKINLQEKMSF